MRSIHCEEITAAVERLCVEANCLLGEDLRARLEAAARQEESPVGRAILADLKENYRLAEESMVPICQDTGMAVVFCDLGQEVHIEGGLLADAVNEGVRRGYMGGKLRCSVVADPLERVNTGDNTPAVLHLRLVAGDQLHITVAPKGFGSENMSTLKMFKPSASQQDIEDYIVDCVSNAGSNPCPPIVLGVGIGGTFELAALTAKRALLRPAGEANPLPRYREMEERLLARINRLGIGPMGLGGRITALAVHVDAVPTHIAGLPVAVNFNCHVTRHQSVTL